MVKAIRMRRRDLPVVELEGDKEPAEVVRLEKIVDVQPSADLTETEAQLRTLRREVADLRKLMAKGKKAGENYRFYPQRGPDGLIERVDAVILKDSATLLERHADRMH